MSQETNYNLSEYKAVLLKVLRVFTKFCQEHKLRWFACGGTAIGAVRHCGFIPWDDDIDVYMPREDYDKFLSLQEQLANGGGEYEDYAIISRKDKGYYLPFAKFSYSKTTLWEYAVKPYILGVYIDVFCLDQIVLGNVEHIKLANEHELLTGNYARSLCRYTVTDIATSLRTEGPKMALSVIWDIIYHRFRSERYVRCIEQQEEYIRSIKGTHYYCYGLYPYREHECFRIEDFNDYVELPFEDLMVRMPKGYDAYLRSQFGDYMQLPPEDRRASHHPRFYVNLREALTLDEVKKIMKRKG